MPDINHEIRQQFLLTEQLRSIVKVGSPVLASHVVDALNEASEVITKLITQAHTTLPQEAGINENGVLFIYDDESTYPPENTFVVTNISPNEPVYFDRKQNTWWTAISSSDVPDIYSRDDIGHIDGGELYWQPIAFKKVDTLFIPAEKQ